jgi:two-component system, OmpR family, phosphate regulon sensor histidine kinase PhoR
MIAVDFQFALYLFLLLVAGAVLFAVALDRRRFRDPLLLRSGAGDAELGRLLDAAPFGLMLLDHDRRCRYANQTAGELLSWPLRWGRLPDAPWRAELVEDLATAQHSGQPHYRALHLPDGRSLTWWLCPLPRLSLLVLADQSRQARLERASRAFLGTLSHELRTPLTAVLAHMAVVRGEDVAEPVREKSLAVVQQEAERLARLVQDLLHLGRLEMSEGVERRPLDLVLVAEATIAEVILAAEKRDIAVSLEAETPLPRVLGDGDSLQRAFLNLLDNSVKYSRPGDSVVVGLSPVPAGVRVTIADSGPGIPPEHLPHVAERLYRGRTDIAGSGLGLSVVAEILRQHEATLHVANRAEGGVLVTFTLPPAGSRTQASPAVASHAPSLSP